VTIRRLQHIGMAVSDLRQACDWFENTFGLKARDFRNDQGRGMQLDARILLGNQCWLHIVQNWNPASRVNQFLHSHGPGLEHISLETDSIEADIQHLRDLGVPIFGDKIFDAPDGFEAFVYPEHTLCMTVELIQPHATSWSYPDADLPVSDRLGIRRLDHVGLAVVDCAAACERLESLFGLRVSTPAPNPRFELRNDCWLSLEQGSGTGTSIDTFLSRFGPGLDHIAFETVSLQLDMQHPELASEPQSAVPLSHWDRHSGVSVAPNETIGARVELIQVQD
jgi:methylmalonyl-CoA/ethylmalonyl-CoA epimerase